MPKKPGVSSTLQNLSTLKRLPVYFSKRSEAEGRAELRIYMGTILPPTLSPLLRKKVLYTGKFLISLHWDTRVLLFYSLVPLTLSPLLEKKFYTYIHESTTALFTCATNIFSSFGKKVFTWPGSKSHKIALFTCATNFVSSLRKKFYTKVSNSKVVKAT